MQPPQILSHQTPSLSMELYKIPYVEKFIFPFTGSEGPSPTLEKLLPHHNSFTKLYTWHTPDRNCSPCNQQTLTLPSDYQTENPMLCIALSDVMQLLACITIPGHYLHPLTPVCDWMRPTATNLSAVCGSSLDAAVLDFTHMWSWK